MKRKTILAAALLLAVAHLQAQTAVTNSFLLTPASAIPDGNPVGLTEQFSVSGLGGTIANVQMQLDIAGGFNGDLYAYLVSPQGQMAILLNRVGVDGSHPSGYGNAGFNLTLDDASADNVHFYQSGSYTLAGGQLTGTWAADGRNVDPQSAASAFASADASSGLNLYYGVNGGDVNGLWTLFIADLAAGGGSPILNQAALTIISVPEPQTGVLLAGGFAMFLLLCKKRRG